MPTITVNTSYRVYSDERLTFVDQTGFELLQQNNAVVPQLAIAGSADVSVTQSGYQRIVGVAAGYIWDRPAGATVTIESTGSLRVVNPGNGEATGYLGAYTNSPDFANAGRFVVSSGGTASGVFGGSFGDWSFANSGDFRVTSATGPATGVWMTYGGRFQNSGTMLVEARDSAVGVSLSGTYHAVDFINHGTIEARDSSAAQDSIAVAWYGTYDGAGGSFVNNGTLQGDYALRAWPYPGFVVSHVDRFTNNGVMVGKVDLGATPAVLTNTGLIYGAVSFGAGNDVYDGVRGQLAAGELHGFDGDDSIAGGAGDETLAGDNGADTINGGGGDDVIEGGRDSDVLDGGAGFNTVSFAHSTAPVSLDLDAGTAASAGQDRLANFQRAAGGGFDDTLSGTGAGDTLSGNAGADVTWARGGADSLSGGDGRDYLRGEDGADTIAGGGDFDDIHGNAGNDVEHGGDGDDWVVGGKDDDLLNGDAGDDIVYGNLGADTCDGGDGADLVRGGQGNDVVLGQAGNDWLSGDRGDDTVTGGTGADIFHGSQDAGLDRVTDFSTAEGDRVQLDPGTTYSLRQEGADTVIDMGGANRMVLVGVTFSSLPTGWIFGI